MKQSSQATVLVYTLVLVTLSVFMATVALNVSTELSNRYEISKLDNFFLSTIKSKSSVIMKYASSVNSDGSGFVDILSCPQNITLSGGTYRTTGITTALKYLSGSVFCYKANAHNAQDLKIFFRNDFKDLYYADLGGNVTAVNSGTLNSVFLDSDATRITLSGIGYFSGDLIDDNFNSDNYKYSSTGATQYPSGYLDNDDSARRKQYGYIVDEVGPVNIFWSNTKLKNAISKNPNNLSQSGVLLLSDASGATLFLDVNKNFSITVYVLNKTEYDASEQIIPIQKYTSSTLTGGIGYFQTNGTLSLVKNASTRIFDFTTNDYAIFLENKASTGALVYNFSFENYATGSGVYFVGLNDSDNGMYSYFGNHLILGEDGRFIGDSREIFGAK